MNLEATFGTSRPVIGMVHLPPLPGTPASDDDIESVLERALDDAQALEAGGVDGLLLENFGDAPFYPDSVPAHTVASMTRVATEIADTVSLPLGVNVLRNDAGAALSVAAAVGGDYIRVNVHTGARVTDQGIIEGQAHETLRLRDRLDADVDVFADIDVKHSEPLGGEGSIAHAFADTVGRGLADAVVVSGPATGNAVGTDTLEAVLSAREDLGTETPILVGSGVGSENIVELLAAADGVIVGTALKEGGETTAPVSESRVTDLVERADEVR